MKIGAVVRAVAINGEQITLRRMTGTSPRVATDVSCRVCVQTGGASTLVGNVEQNADRILLTSLEMDAAGWPAPPRDGDQVVYDDGTVAVIRGRAATTVLEDGTVYSLAVVG